VIVRVRGIPDVPTVIGWTLGVTAFLCLASFGYATARRVWCQSVASNAFDNKSRAPAVAARLEPGALVGRITVPRLGISAIVEEGVDDDTLAVAIGHVPGTATPGSSGNVAVAGHRDTFFRALKDLRANDEIELATLHGSFRYRVESWSIVNPEDVAVLRPTSAPRLTLITCYPFEFFGHAPKRFVVRARQIPTL
jgi:LPXTG-site transpeptidase (sortase) family protein